MTVILDNGETLDALPNDAATAAHVVRIEGNADLRGYAHPLPALRRIDGWAILRDYAHALPDGLIVGASLDLRGCTGLDRYCVGRDKRNYAFFGIPMRDGPHVVAGCRNFTGAQALAHWGPGGESDRPDCLALAQKAIALAERVIGDRP